ncbi:MAG: hypothetical protein V2I33_17675 [Kangiellaceae bacterium]|jgi:hypothetical protein|nr:hypothetical protein [Kangiellaceae bacterium]
MALPYLPAHEMREAYDSLQPPQNENNKLAALHAYVGLTWLSSSVWTLIELSAFNEIERTNNAVEDWHSGFAKRAGMRNLNLYRLIDLLGQQATVIALIVCGVSEAAGVRQTPEVQQRNQQLRTAWQEYSTGMASATELLNACTAVVGNHMEIMGIN